MKYQGEDMSTFDKYGDLEQLSDDELLVRQQEVAEEIQQGTYPLHAAMRRLCAMTLEWSARQQSEGRLSEEHGAREAKAREVVHDLHLADDHALKGDNEQALHCIATASATFFTAGFIAARKERTAPLDKLNRDKALLQDKARELARSIWAADSGKELLIGYVANVIWDQMKKDYPDAAMPETADAVREWVKSAAPDYARRGGRPKK